MFNFPIDTYLRCGDRHWPCSRAVLMTHSDYFGRFFVQNEKQLFFNPPAISDEVPSAVNAALNFMYFFDYNDEDYDLEEYENIEDAYPILFNIYVHAVAVKLEMDDLARLAVEKFSARADEEWQTPGFALAVQEIYAVRPDIRALLKEKVVQVCYQHSARLFGVGNSVESDSRIWYPGLNKLLRTIPAFREDLIAADSLQSGEQRYQCPSCDEAFVMRKVSIFEVKRFCCPYCGAREAMQRWKREELPQQEGQGGEREERPLDSEDERTTVEARRPRASREALMLGLQQDYGSANFKRL